MMVNKMKINEHPKIQERLKRREQKEAREEQKVTDNLQVDLFNDLIASLSAAGYTLKNVMFIVEDLMKKGWTKQPMKRIKPIGS